MIVAGVGIPVAAGLLTALLLRRSLELPVPIWLGVAGGAALGVVGQLADLAKSVLKREVGVKDSGTFFPGHGGVLDRLDALFFTLPIAYAMVRLVLRRRHAHFRTLLNRPWSGAEPNAMRG